VNHEAAVTEPATSRPDGSEGAATAHAASRHDVDEERAKLGAILGLDGPVPADVLAAAVRDPGYAQNLLVARGEPRFLARLLANPPAPPRPEAPPSLTELATSAATSLSRWARAGFSTVDASRYDARMAACAACPHLQAPPESRRALYDLAGAKAGDRSVCGRCGCVVATKARRPHDACPDPDPQHPGRNRWGEPLPTSPGRQST
jgi:hypothetical protein